MKFSTFIASFAFLFLIVGNANCLFIEIHHALDLKRPDVFTYRGNVTLPNLSSWQATVLQETLTDDEQYALQKLAEENDFYRLRLVVKYDTGNKQSYTTYSKACSLLQSQLNDVLWISIDNTGFVTSITQTTSHYGPSECQFSDSTPFVLNDFNTEILTRQTEVAPGPDTLSFIQKMEREREARENGETRDNRGFLAKYWMYIVPVVLLVFISGATNQDQAK